MIEMDEIIKDLKSRGLLKVIKRYSYKYDMDTALYAVKRIGMERNPKFVIDEKNRFVYENLIRWVFGDEDMRCLDPETKEEIQGRINSGIYISGNTGSGKSWALEIMTALSTIDNIQIYTGSSERCLHWSNYRVDEICDEYKKNGVIERFKLSPIIGIQDLGSEKTESMYMGNRENVMKNIIEYRGDRTDVITLITSNIPMIHNKIIELYGSRVSSRLKEMCNYFELKGIDRRR